MVSLNVKSYTVKSSKSGHHIPVVNDVHIHSVYNPIREAESFIEKNQMLIQSKPVLLILGLGFGYHVNLANQLLHNTQFRSHRIVVIEPIKRVYKDCCNLNLLQSAAVTVYAGVEIPALYENHDFVNFLLQKPSILAHPATFNLHREYFKQLLSFRASTRIEETIKNIDDSALKQFLAQRLSHQSLDELIDHVDYSQSQLGTNEEYLLLAFKHLCASKTCVKEAM